MQINNDIKRRDFLDWTTHGLGGAAISSLMLEDGFASQALKAHHIPHNKQVIHICLCGGVSQVDSFDYKPKLKEMHGKSLQADEKPDVFFGKVGLLRSNDWEFKQRGQSGMWISDLFPHISTVADELTVINSMVAESSSHTPATFQESSGFRLNGFPVMGSWVSYGLGNLTSDLPTYVVLPDSRGMPAGSTSNWTNGFLPARHQGVPFRTSGDGNAISNLFPAEKIEPMVESNSRNLLKKMNDLHMKETGTNDTLAARIASYELAARMQLAVPEVTSIEAETEKTRENYGLNGKETRDFGRSCLLARRLLERGVRHVQLFSGGSFGSPRINWDGHEDMKRNHGRESLRIDQPVAALIKDLRSRGMLDETLVLFTSEFGRTPFTQSASDKVGTGRDHNQVGFSVWLAGGGLKSGINYGATDDIGYKSVIDPVPWHDFHATVLHLLGVDHERLTYYHNGIQRRLTNVHGNVLSGILA
ncbi:MAG: DUF1501 domain-containing protein [Verrucomicrobiota bacterium]|jgi:hypothetical protein|nr:DUF1501 domain-containing protein [Verrucomicrobiota bacterium]MEC8906435.1 DUF1501 domain-containing protein [Verrucomicrobiota bacterium]MED6298682.1 DUF1501 domain-containing protein [Verrucomicrobiota bacterium]